MAFMSPIAVALSGGTDSLLSLLLLQESGADVMAVHALFAPQADPAVTERLEELCARRGVPWHLLDLRQEFTELVITPFIQAYQNGHTPNPCALCNPTMKFGLLQDRVRALGATALATGHYCRLDQTAQRPCLRRGHDPVKDQSYFLSLVPPQRLRHVLFPLGDWTKDRARHALAQRGMIPPAPEESQEICFIPNDYRDFLRQRRVALSGPGPIVLRDGTILGTHSGLWNHTLGQRKGLGVAFFEPLYVLAKDHATNRLIVGPKSQARASTVRTGLPNLLCPPQEWPTEVMVQTIYRQRPLPACVDIDAHGMTITFAEPRSLATPGQVAAVYSLEGEVLAGALIVPNPGEPS